MSDDSTNTQTSTLHFGSWFLALLTIAAIWVFSIFAINQHRSIQKIFEDFGTELPWLTILVLQIPDSAIITGGGLLTVFLLVKELLLRNRLHALIINIAVLASYVVLFEIYREALSLPLLKLLNELS